MASQEARGVDWSFPMNPSHLPPKSPGSFPSLGAAAGAGDSKRVGNHKRTPSVGYLPHTQATWMEGVVDAVEGPMKRGAHRRSASESMAFLEGNSNFSKTIEDNGTEDDDYESRSVASMHSGGHSGGHSGAGSVDFDRLDEDQLMSMFSNEQQQQWVELANLKNINNTEPTNHDDNDNNNNNNKGGTTATPSGSDNTWASRATTTTKMQNNNMNSEQPATPSDSNSVASEVSNEDLKGGGGGQSSGGDHEGGVTQTFSKTELQAALAGLDSSLDPKRAKRILANRQSAQRSRVRKLQYISELERSVTTLQSEVSTMAPQVAFFEHRRAVLNVDNNTIKQKMAALLQGQRFKDAHNEALQKEVQRLRQLYQQQQQHQIQQQQSQHLQQNVPTSDYQGESSIGAVPDIFASTTDTTMSTGSVSPTHSRSRPLPHMVASTW